MVQNQTPADTTDEVSELLDEKALQDIKAKSVSGAISYFVRTLFLQGIGLVTAIVLSEYFSPADFGIYGYVTQFIGLLIFFSDIGLAASLIQKKNEPTTEELRTVFTIQQGLSWFIFAIVLLLSTTHIISDKVGMAGAWVFLALGISFPLASLKTVSAVKLERELNFSRLVIPQIIEQIVFNVLLVFLAFRGAGVIAYAYAILARSVIGAATMFYLEPWKIGFGFNKAAAKELLHFGGRFQLNDFLARIKDNLFYLALGWYFTPTQFGYISWAKNWSMYPYNLTVQNVMLITFPTFSRLQHNKQALQRAIEKSLFFITISIFPILVGMALFIQPLLQVVHREAKWGPAVMSFIFFSLSIGWSAVSSPLTNTLNAIGKVGITLKLMIMWTGLTWILTPLAIYFYGYNGVAISAFFIAFTSLLPVYYVKQHVPFNFFEQVWRQTVAVGIMAAVGLVGMNYWTQSFYWLILGGMLSGGSYLLILLITGKEKILAEVKSLK